MLIIMRSKSTGRYVTSYVSNGGIYFRYNSDNPDKAKRFTPKQLEYWEAHGKLRGAMLNLERIHVDK